MTGTPVQLKLTEDQSCKVEEVARHEDISMAEVVLRALDYWLKLHSELSFDEREHWMAQVRRQFHSEQRDRGECRDRDFTEIYVEEISHLDAEKRKRAFDVIRDLDGKYHSGLSDVSEKHDDYLVESYGTWKSS